MVTTNDSLVSLASTLSKLQKSYETMTKKGSDTTLVKRRLDAVKIGLESLKNEEFSHDQIAISTAINDLRDILSVVTVQLGNTSHKTLIERRIRALQDAISSLEKRV